MPPHSWLHWWPNTIVVGNGRALLTGPRHRFDLEAMRAKYGLPAGRTTEEIASAAEEAIARMDQATRAEMARQGLL